MRKLFYLALVSLSSVSILLLYTSPLFAWTGNVPSANLPQGIDPIASYNSLDVPDITSSDSFITYKQGANPDRIYMFVAYGANQIRIGTAGGQSFISSASGTWNRFFINSNGTNGVLLQDWSNAEYDVTQVYQAYRIFYDGYTGVEFPAYQFPVTPDPEPEPEPEQPEAIRFGQYVGFILTIGIGGYVVWLLRYKQ